MDNILYENERLKKELELANEKIQVLKGKMGAWRRKAENRSPQLKGVIRQGFDQWRRVHYKVYVLEFPQDIEIKDVLKEIHPFLQTVKPYQFSRMDYSKKYDGYMIQVEHFKNWDINKGFFED